MNRTQEFCLTFLYSLSFVIPVSGAERVAFVVGNDNYPDIPLENAVRDATAIRDLLGKELGFEKEAIHFMSNAGRLEFFELFENFIKAAQDAEIIIFYYAGHGMESLDGRENFILPVDADVQRAAQSEAALRATGINLMSLSSDLARKTTGAKVILMDACRERPAGRTVASRSGGGLAVYEDKRIPADTLIMLAAAPERVASDGVQHGPFTQALLEVLPLGGQDLMDAFFAVSDRVQEMTKKRQIPWLKFDGSGKVFRTRHFLSGGMPESSIKSTAPKPLKPAEHLRAATREAPFVNSLGLEFIPLPGNPGVYLCRTETRVRDFATFVNATGYDAVGRGISTLESGGMKNAGGSWNDPRFPSDHPQTLDHAVSGVSWNDAKAFCAWLSERQEETGLRYRLPTDAEWSAAVGIGKYPWGSQFPPPENAGNYAGQEAKIGAWKTTNWQTISGYDDGAPRTAAVGSYPANRFGFFDLGGNVWEWCEDAYEPSANDRDVLDTFTIGDRRSSDGTPYRIQRGGSWNSYFGYESYLRSSFRMPNLPTQRGLHGGFRCVVEAE